MPRWLASGYDLPVVPGTMLGLPDALVPEVSTYLHFGLYVFALCKILEVRDLYLSLFIAALSTVPST